MSVRKIITASLEGMRVSVDEKECELQEYDFVANSWVTKDAAQRPLGAERARDGRPDATILMGLLQSSFLRRRQRQNDGCGT